MTFRNIHDQQGFSAIAVPDRLSSRRSANEGSAISILRPNGEAFAQLGAVGIIDDLLAGGVKNGYIFTGGKIDASNTNPSSFCGRAIPITGTGLNATGPRNVALATDGVLYAAPADDVNNADCSSDTGSFIVISASPLSN